MFSSYYVSDVKWISNGSLFCSWTVRGHRKIVQTVTNVNKNFLTTEVFFFGSKYFQEGSHLCNVGLFSFSPNQFLFISHWSESGKSWIIFRDSQNYSGAMNIVKEVFLKVLCVKSLVQTAIFCHKHIESKN